MLSLVSRLQALETWIRPRSTRIDRRASEEDWTCNFNQSMARGKRLVFRDDHRENGSCVQCRCSHFTIVRTKKEASAI